MEELVGSRWSLLTLQVRYQVRLSGALIRCAHQGERSLHCVEQTPKSVGSMSGISADWRRRYLTIEVGKNIAYLVRSVPKAAGGLAGSEAFRW